MDRVLRHLLSVRTSFHISSIQRTKQPTSLLWNSSQSLAPLVFSRFSSNSTEPLNDKPIPYSKSKSHAYKATENWREYVYTEADMTYANSTSFIVKSSIIIFLIYFCILREPNDIDQMLDRDLFEIMPELELPILENEIKRLKAHGVSTAELEKKVEELKKLSATKSDG